MKENFGKSSKLQPAIRTLCPVSGVLERTPNTRITPSNSARQKVLSSFAEYSITMPGSFTCRQFSLPKQVLQKSFGGHVTFWHFVHSPIENFPLFNSDSKIMIALPKQLMMLQQPTCFEQGLFWHFLPVFLSSIPESDL